MKIQIGNLIKDPELTELRRIDAHVVSRYRQAYRAGDDLGKPIIDSKSKTVVSGNHRVMALLEEYGPEHVVDVESRAFKTRAEILRTFAAENVAHGLPLTGYSRRAIAHAMKREGMTEDEIAETFKVSVKRLESWEGVEVAVIGKGSMPRKAGPDIDGKTLTPQQYEDHRKKDIGLPIKYMADQLTRWARNGFMNDLNEEDRECLKEMIAALQEVI